MTDHTLHLWGRLSSINVRKVVWTLQHLNVPFLRTDAGMAFGVVNTPAYQALNPNAATTVRTRMSPTGAVAGTRTVARGGFGSTGRGMSAGS